MYDEINTRRVESYGTPQGLMAVKTHIKIFGERHTGTNFLAELCELNFDVPVISSRAVSYVKAFYRLKPLMPYTLHWRILQGLRAATFAARYKTTWGWKHGSVLSDPSDPRFYPDDLAILCVVKHPIAWAMSLKRRPYETFVHPARIERLSLAEFVRSPWRPVPFENHKAVFPTVMDLWNVKVRSYFELASVRPVMVVRYEDLLDDPENAVSSIAEFYGLSRRPAFSNASSGAKRNWASQEGQQKKDFKHYRDYYLQERWRSKLPENHLSIFADIVDPELVQRLRYTL